MGESESTEKCTGLKGRPVGELVPQEHGGALRNGGPSKGGTGRPASEIRSQCRGSFANRIHVAEQIADSAKASESDKLRALDLLGKYGVGDKLTLELGNTQVLEAVSKVAAKYIVDQDAFSAFAAEVQAILGG